MAHLILIDNLYPHQKIAWHHTYVQNIDPTLQDFLLSNNRGQFVVHMTNQPCDTWEELQQKEPFFQDYTKIDNLTDFLDYIDKEKKKQL